MQADECFAGSEKNGIRLSDRLAELTIKTDPFARFALDNVFDGERYRLITHEFAKSFESLGLGDPRSRKGKSGKNAVSSGANDAEFNQMLEMSPHLRALIHSMNSHSFLYDLQQIFADSIRAVHPDIWDAHWTIVPDNGQFDSSSVDSVPVNVSFQFGRMYPGAFLEPHKDSLSKIITLIFYLAPEDWDASWKGSTSFYHLPFLEGNCDLVNFYYSYGDATKIDEFPFEPNRMVGFVKSNRSYHGVEPIMCPKGRSRDSLILNVKRASLAGSRPLRRRFYRVIDRLAGRRPGTGIVS